MANGYDSHSLAMTGLKEAVSSTSIPPTVAVRDKRYTRTGIGWRSQVPAIESSSDYAGGVAARMRGMVDESQLPWETAQEATKPQIRPRDSLPPWLRGKEGEDEEGEDEEDDGKKGDARKALKGKGSTSKGK